MMISLNNSGVVELQCFKRFKLYQKLGSGCHLASSFFFCFVNNFEKDSALFPKSLVGM